MSIPPLPKIPLSRGVPAEVRRALDALAVAASQIQARAAAAGNGETNYVYQDGGTTVIDEPGIVVPIDTPTDPAGLVAEGLYETTLLKWGHPCYLGHAYTVVRRSDSPMPQQAVIIGTTDTAMFVDKPPIRGKTYYYWITHVNLDGVGDDFVQRASASQNNFTADFNSGASGFTLFSGAAISSQRLTLSANGSYARAATPMRRKFAVEFDYISPGMEDDTYKTVTVTLGASSSLTGAGRYTVKITEENDGLDYGRSIEIAKDGGVPLASGGFANALFGSGRVRIEVNADTVRVLFNGVTVTATDTSLNAFEYLFFSLWQQYNPAATGIDNIAVTGDQATGGVAEPVTATTTNDPAVLLNKLAGSLGYDQFNMAAGVFPIRTVDSLPTLPNAAWPAGSQVYLSTNGKLYRTPTGLAGSWTSAVSASDLKNITATQLAAGLEPVSMVDSLPPAVGYTGPKTVMLKSTWQIFRWFNDPELGPQWSSAYSAADLGGQLTASQIAASAVRAHHIVTGAITADKVKANSIESGNIAVGAITADKIGAGEILTNTANFVDAVITNAHIHDLAADKLAAGTITSDLVVVGSTLRDVGSTFHIDMGQNKTFVIQGSQPDYRSELTEGDLRFFVPGIPTPYKACRRVVRGEAVDGEYVPFDPPFYTTPKVIVGPTSIETMPGAADKEVGSRVYSAADNVTASGFTLLAKNKKFTNSSQIDSYQGFGYYDYEGTEPDVSGINETVWPCWVSPLLPLNVARVVFAVDLSSIGQPDPILRVWNTYYREGTSGPWIKAEDHYFQNTSRPMAPAPHQAMFDTTKRYQVMVYFLGATGMNAHLTNSRLLSHILFYAYDLPHSGPTAFIAIEGG